MSHPLPSSLPQLPSLSLQFTGMDPITVSSMGRALPVPGPGNLLFPLPAMLFCELWLQRLTHCSNVAAETALRLALPHMLLVYMSGHCHSTACIYSCAFWCLSSSRVLALQGLAGPVFPAPLPPRCACAVLVATEQT